MADVGFIYVTVGNEPVLDRTRLATLVKKRLAILNYIEGRLQDPKYLATYVEGEAQAHLERVARARTVYERLLSGASGRQ